MAFKYTRNVVLLKSQDPHKQSEMLGRECSVGQRQLRGEVTAVLVKASCCVASPCHAGQIIPTLVSSELKEKQVERWGISKISGSRSHDPPSVFWVHSPGYLTLRTTLVPLRSTGLCWMPKIFNELVRVKGGQNGGAFWSIP